MAGSLALRSLTRIRSRCERARDLRCRLAIEPAGDESTRLRERIEINAGGDVHAVQHIDDVLRCDIAARALGVGASAEARDGAVNDRHAKFEAAKIFARAWP